MTGFRQPTSREQRRQWWRRQLSRQRSANLSVTEFCRQLGVSLTTFYYWKKRASEPSPDAGRNPAEYLSRPMTKSSDASVPSFMPVSILDPAAGTQLEIELANACVVRLKGTIDPALLQAAIAAAGQLNGSGQGAE